MADLSINLKNLLNRLNYQLAMASNQNASNIVASANKNASTKPATNTTVVETKPNTNTNTTNNVSTTNKVSSNLDKITNNSFSKENEINNPFTISNDMELEFFKTYKNAVTASIYNKLKNNLSITERDLTNFKNQVKKLSADEKKLWKTEINSIQTKLESKLPKVDTNVTNNTGSVTNNTETNNTTKVETTEIKPTVLNGFVNNILYKDGTKFSGIYTDGKYYQSGLLASGTYNNKLYINGELYTGTKSGLYYQNGVLFTGTINGYQYVNGVIKVETQTQKPSTETQNNAVANTIAQKTIKENGDVYGYDKNKNLVYLEKTVNGKKVIYDDELKYLDKKTINYLATTEEAVLNDRILNDIEAIKNAEQKALAAGEVGTSEYNVAYNNAIKSQLIKNTTTMTGEAGELVESNGSLYINDGTKLVKLNISAETYLELFPPVERFSVNQNNIGDCYFISGCLTDMVKNPEVYAKLLQTFSEDSNGNITIKFSGTLKNYPVTFKNGEPKVLDGLVDGKTVKKYTNAAGSLGATLLEQAYSIAVFSRETKESVKSIDIDEATAIISSGGWQHNVYKEVLDIDSEMIRVNTNNISTYLNTVANKVNNGEVLLSFASYGNLSEYNLSSGHAYSIEKIDTKNKVIYITNPWHNGGSTAIPFSAFAEAEYEKNGLIYFNAGYLS